MFQAQVFIDWLDWTLKWMCISAYYLLFSILTAHRITDLTFPQISFSWYKFFFVLFSVFFFYLYIDSEHYYHLVAICAHTYSLFQAPVQPVSSYTKISSDLRKIGSNQGAGTFWTRTLKWNFLQASQWLTVACMKANVLKTNSDTVKVLPFNTTKGELKGEFKPVLVHVRTAAHVQLPHASVIPDLFFCNLTVSWCCCADALVISMMFTFLCFDFTCFVSHWERGGPVVHQFTPNSGFYTLQP